MCDRRFKLRPAFWAPLEKGFIWTFERERPWTKQQPENANAHFQMWLFRMNEEICIRWILNESLIERENDSHGDALSLLCVALWLLGRLKKGFAPGKALGLFASVKILCRCNYLRVFRAFSDTCCTWISCYLWTVCLAFHRLRTSSGFQ